MSVTASLGERRSADRARGWSGIVFAVLYFAGMVPMGELLGSFGDPDATFVAFFEVDGNRIGTLVAGLVLGLAGVSFLWFLSNLCLTTTGSGPLPGIVAAAGTAFVALHFAGTASLVTVPYARTFGGAYGDDGILAANDALLPQLGYVLLTVFAMWVAAAMIIAVTISWRRSGIVPRWLVRVGFASAAFVFLLGWSVGGTVGLPLWTLCVAIHSLRQARPATTDAVSERVEDAGKH